MPDPTRHYRICVRRAGYATVPGDTEQEAIENAAALGASDFDWEPVDADMIRDEAEVVEAVGPNGESLPRKEE